MLLENCRNGLIAYEVVHKSHEGKPVVQIRSNKFIGYMTNKLTYSVIIEFNQSRFSTGVTDNNGSDHLLAFPFAISNPAQF